MTMINSKINALKNYDKSCTKKLKHCLECSYERMQSIILAQYWE